MSIESFFQNRLTLKVVFSLIVWSFFWGLSGKVCLAAPEIPQFSLPTITDGTIIDSKQLRGKVVLINFWATWCPPCRKEIPYLKRLQTEFGDKGLVVLGISIDQGGGRVVKKFIKKSKINYPVMLANQSVLRQFGGVRGVPTSFLLDKTGRKYKSYLGYAAYQILRNDIAKLLD